MQRFQRPLLVIGLLALILTGCAGQTASADATAQPTQATPSSIEATGIVVPEKWTAISFSAGGRIVRLPVSVGDEVHQGATLARLDGTDANQAVEMAQLKVSEAEVNVRLAQHGLDLLVHWSPDKNRVAAAEAALANAEAAVEQAQAAYDKVAWMPGVSATPQSLQLEQATNNYNLAKANLDALYSSRPDIKKAVDSLDLANVALEEARLNLEIVQAIADKMVLHAPFDGVVNQVLVHEQEFVAPGTPILILADLSTLQIETTDLNESDVVNVAVGDKVTVTFEALPGVEVEGWVTEIAPKAAEGIGVNYTVTVKLAEMPEGIRWGMTAYISIPPEQ